jgi:hypothetical protein
MLQIVCARASIGACAECEASPIEDLRIVRRDAEVRTLVGALARASETLPLLNDLLVTFWDPLVADFVSDLRVSATILVLTFMPLVYLYTFETARRRRF